MTDRRWQLSDLLDLERELELDRQSGSVATPVADPRAEPGDLLYAWMSARRDPNTVSFGERFRRSELLLLWVGALLSFVSGLALTAGLLSYAGDVLINVMVFLAVAVGLQLASLLLTAAALVINRFRPTAGQWLLRMTRVEFISRQLTLSSPLIRLQAFGLLQAWAVALNIGILLAMLFKVFFFDLSFGWATTLDVSARQVRELLAMLSLPWGDAFPDAVPSLEEVERSRILLVEGTAGTGAASWWKFLFAAVLTYGLLPRLLLWMIARGLVFWRLSRLQFTTAACQSLILRLRQPLDADRAQVSDRTGRVPSELPSAPAPAGRYQLRLPVGWGQQVDLAGLAAGFGVEVGAQEADRRQLRLVEAWRPPLEQDLVELQDSLADSPRDGVILLGMIGLTEGERLVAPDDEDLAIWSEFVRRRVNDARVAVVPFREAAA
jgi:hypothetical protein